MQGASIQILESSVPTMQGASIQILELSVPLIQGASIQTLESSVPPPNAGCLHSNPFKVTVSN